VDFFSFFFLQYEPRSADLYVFGSPKNTEGYQFSKTFFGVIFANNPNLEESRPIKHAAPLQDAGFTARRPLEFTTWRAVGRLTQVRGGRGAKRGELRGAAGACWAAAVPQGGGVPTKCMVGTRTSFVGCSLIFYYSRFCIRLHFRARTVVFSPLKRHQTSTMQVEDGWCRGECDRL
jgi:hypothetical protein